MNHTLYLSMDPALLLSLIAAWRRGLGCGIRPDWSDLSRLFAMESAAAWRGLTTEVD